jgi:hypothetical protein
VRAAPCSSTFETSCARSIALAPPRVTSTVGFGLLSQAATAAAARKIATLRRIVVS